MSDLVGNPEDRLSQNKAHLAATVETPVIIFFLKLHYENMPICFKHQIFTAVKKKDFQMKTFDVFIIFA